MGKGGNLCSHARSGEIRCPLIVRPTQRGRHHRPPLPGARLPEPPVVAPRPAQHRPGDVRFRRQSSAASRSTSGRTSPATRGNFCPGTRAARRSTLITWENPPTTVFIEAKYGSALSANVSGDDGRAGFPSDQLDPQHPGRPPAGRLLPAGRQLFAQPARGTSSSWCSPPPRAIRSWIDTATATSPGSHPPRRPAHRPAPGPVRRRTQLRRHHRPAPRQSRWFNRAERLVAADLSDYLEYKLSSRTVRPDRPAIIEPSPTHLPMTSLALA